MKIADALVGVKDLYIDTAPFIYFIEQNVTYIHRMRAIFRQVDIGNPKAVSSVITLTEVLAHPLRAGNRGLVQAYRNILLNSQYFLILPVTAVIAEQAAEMRSKYNLRTPDALHISSAISSHCDAFLTNDRGLLRVTELEIILVDDLDEPPQSAT